MDMNPGQLVESWINKFITTNKSRYSIKQVKDRYICNLYTENYHYQISCTGNYMGCIVTSRKYRAGEDWLRGNDLHDGPLEDVTFAKILFDIVAYELKDIERNNPISNKEVHVHND